MTLKTFIRKVNDGEVVVGFGNRTISDKIADGYTILSTTGPDHDAKNVTAEAYNQEVFPHDKDWDEALKEVEEALAAEGKQA
jgi:hypothetical protein